MILLQYNMPKNQTLHYYLPIFSNEGSELQANISGYYLVCMQHPLLDKHECMHIQVHSPFAIL